MFKQFWTEANLAVSSIKDGVNDGAGVNDRAGVLEGKPGGREAVGRKNQELSSSNTAQINEIVCEK